MTEITDLRSKLAEYEKIVPQLVARLRETVDENDRLRAENECLKAGLDAHSTLKSIYGDSSQPAAVRVRAASAALNVETPSLKPQSPPLDLPCEEIEPLAVLVEKRRARMNQLLAMPLEERAALIPGCGNGGNGSGD